MLTLLIAFLYIQLFHFDVHEDVRTIADATIEKDEVRFWPVHFYHYFELKVYRIVKARYMLVLSLVVLVNLTSGFLVN